MRRLSQGLVAAVDESQLLEHALTKGEIREEDVIAAFRPFVPERFSLGKGVVVNVDGEQSLQQDLVIADAQAGTRFIAGGNIGVYPVEIVHGTVQIKSVASPGEVRSAVENVASVKRLMPDEHRVTAGVRASGRFSIIGERAKLFGGILFLTSGKTDVEAIGAAFTETNLSLDDVDRIDALCVLNEYAIGWASKQMLPPHQWLRTIDSLHGQHVRVDVVGRDAMLLFYAVMMARIMSYAPPQFQLHLYANQVQLESFRGTYMWGPDGQPFWPDEDE